MSTYYQCRFMDVVIDTRERPDIYKWLEQLNDPASMDKEDGDLSVPSGMPKESSCVTFYNSFSEGLDQIIDLNDPSNVKLNFCLGNKNKDRDIEGLIYLLRPYIKSGYIFFYNENYVSEVNLEKSFPDGYPGKEAMFYSPLRFYTRDESVERHKKIIGDMGNGPFEYDYDPLYELLHYDLD